MKTLSYMFSPKVLRKWAWLLLAIVIVSVSYTSVRANAFLVDQEMTTAGRSKISIRYASPVGQEFKPTQSALDVVELYTYDFGSPENETGAELSVNIREGNITGNVIGTSLPVTLPDSFGGITHFDFPSTVSLTPGHVYVIEPVVISGDTWAWARNDDNEYPAGRAIEFGNPYPSSDFLFKEGPSIPDSTPPDTNITAQPADPTNSTSASFEFSGTDDVSDPANLTFECKLGDGGFSTCTSPQNYNSLSEGSHTFEVRATDEASNTDPSPASFSWVVDITPPDTNITAQPADPTNSTSASFEFSGTDDVSAPANLSFECQLDGGGFSTCTSPQNYNSLSEGSHTFEVRATDEASNTDPSPASFSWVVDITPPVVTVPPDQEVVATGPVAVNYPAATATDADPPNPTVNCIPASGSTFDVGVTKVTCSATDAAGNVGQASFNVTVLTPKQAAENLSTQVQDLVGAGVLGGGQGNALTSKLQNAIKSTDKGNANAAINQLQAFINQINALINGGTLTPAEGQPLIDAATAIIAALGG